MKTKKIHSLGRLIKFTSLVLSVLCESARAPVQCCRLGTRDDGDSLSTHTCMVTEVKKIGLCEMCSDS